MLRCLIVMLLTFVMSLTVKSKRAFLDIILYEVNQDDGRYMMHKTGITGEFSNFGTAGAAEGDIIQMHPHSVCEDSDNGEEFDYGWVGVIKLSYHPADSCHLVEKARRAVEKGATAVIFDITDYPDSWRQLSEQSLNSLNQPIVLVEGMDATELMKIIKGEQIARAVIKRGQPDRESFGSQLTDSALLMVCIVVIIVVAALAIRKMKCRKNRQQNSLHDWTMQHTEMRRYRKKRARERFAYEATSDASTASSLLCAICLDTFQDEQDLRVLECLHEFHLGCIDAWLKQKRSCPLCNRSFSSLLKEVACPGSSHQAADEVPNRSESAEISTQMLQTRALTHMNFTQGNQQFDTTASPLAGSQPECLGLHSGLPRDDCSNVTSKMSCSSSDFELDSDEEMYQLLCQDCNSHNGTHKYNTLTNYGTHNAQVTIKAPHRKPGSEKPCACATTGDRSSSRTFPIRSYRRSAPLFKYYAAASHGKRTKEHLRLHNGVHGRHGSEGSVNAAATERCGFSSYGSSNDASVTAVHGSSVPVDSSSRSCLSFATSFTSKVVEYSSDSSGSVLRAQNCFLFDRTPTPCIECSSSDGAGNFGWASYTTLEDVLGGIEGGSSCTLADL